MNSLNLEVLERFPGANHLFHSADYILTSEQNEDDVMLNYSIEHLNSINCSGLSLAKLLLKVGCSVIILKNLDAPHEVCNRSRGILTRYRNRVLEVKLLNGQHAGETVFISRICNQPTED